MGDHSGKRMKQHVGRGVSVAAPIHARHEISFSVLRLLPMHYATKMTLVALSALADISTTVKHSRGSLAFDRPLVTDCFHLLY